MSLPEPSLRSAGANFVQDPDFLQFAASDVSLINEYASAAGSRLLDFGCGVGRLYYGFSVRDEPYKYVGVDIRNTLIKAAESNISVRNERFKFIVCDVRHERYNPDGCKSNGVWSQVIGLNFDIIYSYSVFSHLNEHDVRDVLGLFLSVSHRDTKFFITAFVANQNEPVLVNPPTKGLKLKGPLHVVRYDKAYFENEILAGFNIVTALEGRATDGQIFYVLDRAS